MMSQENTIQINIAGKSYLIKCPSELKGRLQAAAEYLNDQLNATSPSTLNQQQFIMTGLRMSHEFLEMKEKHAQYIEHIQRRIEALEQKIEFAMNQPEQYDAFSEIEESSEP